MPDIIAKICLYTKEEGGSFKTPISVQLRTTFVYEGHYSDCAILLDQIGISLNTGEHTEVPIKFLTPWLIKPLLQPGSKFKLWAGQNVGEGEVEKIVNVSAQEGSSVVITIGNTLFHGKIIKAGKNRANRLNALIQLDEPTCVNGFIGEYLIAQDTHTNFWPESFLDVDYPCIINIVSKKDASSSDILGKDLSQTRNDALKGHIKLIDMLS